MENIRLHGMPTTSLDKLLLWKVIRYSYQLFYFLFYISFYISRYHFSKFLEFHSRFSEKNLRPKLSFLNGFTPLSLTPPPYWPKAAKRDKSFMSIFPKTSYEIFFFPKIYWQNPAKHILKVPTTDSFVLISKHSSPTTILTQASVINCK